MHTIIQNELYRKAFVAYLRRGILPELFIKSALDKVNHITEKYIWRTQGDDKVRRSHAAHEGDIIAWDDPQDIGHPGQDYNCRCVAEPYLEDVDPSDLKEGYVETVVQVAEDNVDRWDSIRMAQHYLTGNGMPKTLQELGQLRDIIHHAQNDPIDKEGNSISRRVVNSFADKIRDAGAGLFHGDFERPYDFKPVEWAHGRSTLSGEAHGYVSPIGPFLVFNLTIDYRFSDTFKDPLDIVQIQDLLDEGRIIDVQPRIPFEPGTPYAITGTWRTRIEAVIYRDRDLSLYQRHDDDKPE